MADWFGDMAGLERTYAFCAILGAVLFILRVVLMLFGGDADADVGDVGDVGDLADGVDSDASFRFLSVQGFSAFILIFGLAGLTLSVQFGVAPLWSLTGATAAGGFTMWVVGLLFLFMQRMQSSGNVRMANAVGQVGKVYLHIPAGGLGKIEVVVQGRLMVADAMAKGEVNIPTGAQVKVVGVSGPGTLVVEPLD